MSVHFALMSCRVSWAWLSWVEEVSPAHNRQQILRLPKFWVTLLEIQENGKNITQGWPSKFVRFVECISLSRQPSKGSVSKVIRANVGVMSNSACVEVHSRLGNLRSLQFVVTVGDLMLVFALPVVCFQEATFCCLFGSRTLAHQSCSSVRTSMVRQTVLT